MNNISVYTIVLRKVSQSKVLAVALISIQSLAYNLTADLSKTIGDKTMSLLRLRDARSSYERIVIQNNSNNSRQSPWVGTHQNYLARLETFGRESEGRASPVTMVVVGREGVGKSSLIANTFRGADCETGDRAYPTTNEAKFYEQTEREGTERAVTLRIIDSPGLGGIDKNVKKFKKELSEITNKAADIMLHCVSMSNGSRIGDTDVTIIKALTGAFGKGIWKHTILLLTFANTRNVSEDDYVNLVENYAKQFENALRHAYVFDIKVRSIFSRDLPENDNGSILAVPVGYDPQEPLPRCHNWSDYLFMEVLHQSDPKIPRELLKLKTTDPQEVAEVIGSATAGVAVGTTVGAAVGAPLLVPGVAAGAAAGAVIGGATGIMVPNLITRIKNMFLLRRSVNS